MATGDPLILGKSNSANAGTYLIRNTPRGWNPGPTLWVQCVDTGSTAIRADTAGVASGPAVSAYSFNYWPGVLGETNRGTGVFGKADSRIGVGVRGDGTGDGLAGLFLGHVRVYGNLDVVFGAKSAVVKLPDGSTRRLYCVESPESWFEDFGEAQLVGGQATVRIDPSFSALVRGPYHVFLTPYGESSGLFVNRRTGKSFVVREQGRGKSSLRFSYRIVARRKDIDAPRLAKVKLPKVAPAPRENRGHRPASAPRGKR
jgi:hypothetical protein